MRNARGYCITSVASQVSSYCVQLIEYIDIYYNAVYGYKLFKLTSVLS